ncbi:MAG: zinc-binding dehydrogenase [Rhodobacteraceae bacterium PARR1]|nr:MAG: zinc-binding dehydrogenase [Rhodobacteraceae bacterium PARR1]
MRAWQLTKLGQPPVLSDQSPAMPKAGEVRLCVHACGLNFADLLMAEGRYQDRPALPFVPGLECAGVVEALGSGVTSPAIGTRVAVYGGHGGLAESGCFQADHLVPIPDSMSMVEAAGFLIAYGTSHLALTHKARLQPGETLFVLGAAGGVGLTAVEIGKRLGARVIASARGAEKLAVAQAAGADVVIDSEAPDLKDRLRGLGGVDVCYDPVGGAEFDTTLRAMRPEGRMLSIGFASGTVPQVPANILLVKNVSVMGFWWGGYRNFAPALLRDSLAELMSWHADRRLGLHVSHVLPLAQAPEGLALLRDRAAVGKVVIDCQA